MLPGIRIKPLNRMPDERGSFTEIFRNDWKDLLEGGTVAQANHSVTYPGIIRAWHRHLRGQNDYFLTIKGSIKICGFDDETGELDEIVSSGQNLQLVRMPGHFWHGFKAVGDEPAFLIYFTTRLYNPKDPDEERRPWNDLTLVPKSVNGKKDDPRVGKPWDWNLPPHK